MGEVTDEQLIETDRKLKLAEESEKEAKAKTEELLQKVSRYYPNMNSSAVYGIVVILVFEANSSLGLDKLEFNSRGFGLPKARSRRVVFQTPMG